MAKNMISVMWLEVLFYAAGSGSRKAKPLSLNVNTRALIPQVG